jgi:hypothetical protein
LIGQRVDMIQAVHEFLDLGMVQGMENPADIQLGKVKGHETMVAGPDRDRRAPQPDIIVSGIQVLKSLQVQAEPERAEEEKSWRNRKLSLGDAVS